ncbi:transposase [bacterium]|nr:transposase [bacterium]
MCTKNYSPKFKFQVVMEAVRDEKTVAQLSKQYHIHPASIHRWRNEFLEKGAEIFSQDTTIREYEKEIQDLERLLGDKEVEIALLKNFLTGVSPRKKNSLG